MLFVSVYVYIYGHLIFIIFGSWLIMQSKFPTARFLEQDFWDDMMRYISDFFFIFFIAIGLSILIIKQKKYSALSLIVVSLIFLGLVFFFNIFLPETSFSPSI